MRTILLNGPTAVYRAYNAEGRLLYVGMSRNSDLRMYQHGRGSYWHADMADVDIRWYPDRATARAAELDAIVTEWPLWNVKDSPWAPIVRMAQDLRFEFYEVDKWNRLWLICHGCGGRFPDDFAFCRDGHSTWGECEADIREAARIAAGIDARRET